MQLKLTAASPVFENVHKEKDYFATKPAGGMCFAFKGVRHR